MIASVEHPMGSQEAADDDDDDDDDESDDADFKPGGESDVDEEYDEGSDAGACGLTA